MAVPLYVGVGSQSRFASWCVQSEPRHCIFRLASLLSVWNPSCSACSRCVPHSLQVIYCDGLNEKCPQRLMSEHLASSCVALWWGHGTLWTWRLAAGSISLMTGFERFYSHPTSGPFSLLSAAAEDVLSQILTRASCCHTYQPWWLSPCKPRAG